MQSISISNILAGCTVLGAWLVGMLVVLYLIF